MIVLRSKSFAGVPGQQNNGQQNGFFAASKQLMVEQMRQQRQLVQTIRMREKIQAEERRQKLRMIQQAQKAQLEEKKETLKQIMKANKDSRERGGPENVSLYKTRSTVVTPVPMKH